MAADERYIVAPTSVSDGNYLTIQPGSGVEAILKNIFCAAAAEIYVYDGANSILIDSSPGQNSWLGLALDITNTFYIRVKNVSGSAQYIAASGVQTK